MGFSGLCEQDEIELTSIGIKFSIAEIYEKTRFDLAYPTEEA
jgi:hypothetical protein